MRTLKTESEDRRVAMWVQSYPPYRAGLVVHQGQKQASTVLDPDELREMRDWIDELLEAVKPSLPTAKGSIVANYAGEEAVLVGQLSGSPSKDLWIWSDNALPTAPEKWVHGWSLVRDAGVS